MAGSTMDESGLAGCGADRSLISAERDGYLASPDRTSSVFELGPAARLVEASIPVLSPALFLFFLSFGHAAVPFAKPLHSGECACTARRGVVCQSKGEEWAWEGSASSGEVAASSWDGVETPWDGPETSFEGAEMVSMDQKDDAADCPDAAWCLKDDAEAWKDDAMVSADDAARGKGVACGLEAVSGA